MMLLRMESEAGEVLLLGGCAATLLYLTCQFHFFQSSVYVR